MNGEGGFEYNVLIDFIGIFGWVGYFREIVSMKMLDFIKGVIWQMSEAEMHCHD